MGSWLKIDQGSKGPASKIQGSSKKGLAKSGKVVVEQVGLKSSGRDEEQQMEKEGTGERLTRKEAVGRMASVKKRPETTPKEKSGGGREIEKRPAVGNQENGRWAEIIKSFLVGGKWLR